MGTDHANRPGFRLAEPAEDDLLASILFNAFLYNWDVNWWQNLDSPLAPLDLSPPWATRFSGQILTKQQQNRLDFYRTTLTLVRLVGGTVSVATVVDDAPTALARPAAVLCWLPPKIHITAYALIRSGFLFALFRFGGFVGTWRFLSFELALSRLYDRSLGPLGYRSHHDGAFVQIVGTDPVHIGKGLATGLLKWHIERHHSDCLAGGKSIPVFLDTTGEYQQHVYQRIGFRELGRYRQCPDVNEQGWRSLEDPERKQTFCLRVMMLSD